MVQKEGGVLQFESATPNLFIKNLVPLTLIKHQTALSAYSEGLAEKPQSHTGSGLLAIFLTRHPDLRLQVSPCCTLA